MALISAADAPLFQGGDTVHIVAQLRCSSPSADIGAASAPDRRGLNPLATSQVGRAKTTGTARPNSVMIASTKKDARG